MTTKRSAKKPAEAAPELAWYEQPLASRERIVVLGTTGSGKTYWARKLAMRHKRVIAYDPCGDYLTMGRPMSVAELYDHRELLTADTIRIAVQPDYSDEKEAREEVEALIEIARAAGDLLLVFDEVGDYAPYSAFALARLAANGRHEGLSVVYVSQGAVEIPKAVRRQATRIVSFSQSDPDDLAALERRCGEEFVAAVRAWRPRDPPAIWSLPSVEEE